MGNEAIFLVWAPFHRNVPTDLGNSWLEEGCPFDHFSKSQLSSPFSSKPYTHIYVYIYICMRGYIVETISIVEWSLLQTNPQKRCLQPIIIVNVRQSQILRCLKSQAIMCQKRSRILEEPTNFHVLDYIYI